MREREPRIPVHAAVKISHTTNLYDAIACDLSLNGACIFGSPKLPEDSGLILYWGAAAFPCRVAWARDLFMGVQFHTPLKLKDLYALAGPPPAGLGEVA